VYSALKVRGRPAHRRIRSGERVELEPRDVEIMEFAMDARDGPDVAFSAMVGSGVYIRALAREAGEVLGCGAHLRELRRLAIGTLSVDDAVPLERVGNGPPPVRPLRDAVGHLPAIQVGPGDREALRRGRAIAGAPARPDEPVALLAGDDLVAIAEPSAGMLQPRVVLDA
jgi:tRNA pseudouridine55 synthase